jgi:hypothetical protein
VSDPAQRRRARLFKILGLPSPAMAGAVDDSTEPLRFHISRPRPGFQHPLSRQQIVETLAFFGPLTVYGLKSVELRQVGNGVSGVPVLGRLLVPGTVILYEQPATPWTITGRLSEESLGRLRDAGATVELKPSVTVIDWPGETLAHFMLFDGLMHEVGHHLIQHHTGKRTARVMRTADHERAAERFAAACRSAWVARVEES